MARGNDGQKRFLKQSDYEAFVREDIKETYRAEWHPGDHAPFLGSEKFLKRIAHEKTPPPTARCIRLEELLRKQAARAGFEPQTLRRKGRTAKIVETRDSFIRQAVLEQGYLASELASFLSCHPSNVSRALQKNQRS